MFSYIQNQVLTLTCIKTEGSAHSKHWTIFFRNEHTHIVSLRIRHTMTINTNITDGIVNRSLFDMNAEQVAILIPAIVFVSVLMLIGIIGNSLTVFIFSRKSGPSTHRTFVLFLAVLDLMSCLLSMPFHLSMMLLPYTYYNVYVCKILELVSYSVAYGSVFLITVIAVERYRITCRPFKRRMSAKMAKVCCGICLAVAVVISVPASILYGHSTVETGNGLSGVQCYIDDAHVGTLFPIVFNSLPILITTVSIVMLSVLYSFVIRKLFGSLRFRRSMRALPSSKKTHAQLALRTSKQTTDSDKSHPRDLLNKASSNLNDMSPVSVSTDTSSTSTTGISEPKYSKYRSRLSTFFKDKTIQMPSRPDKCHHKLKCDIKSNNLITVIVEKEKDITKKTEAETTCKRELRTRRTTVILLTITVVFVLSFIPHISLMIAAGTNSHFLPSLTKTELSVFQFFRRTFFINNVANPIIYGFCDTTFRKQFRKIFKFSRASE